MIALSVIVAVQAVLLALLFGATVELHRQILQLRQHAGLVDHARPIEFNSEVATTDLPLAAAHRLGYDDRAALLILSEGCTTCFEIAQHLAAIQPERVMVLVEAHSLDDAAIFLARFGLALGDTIAYDEGGLVAQRFNIIVTPTAIKFDGNVAVAATTIPSTRQLDRVVEWVREPVAQLSHGDGALP